jgi:hypothetical protein
VLRCCAPREILWPGRLRADDPDLGPCSGLRRGAVVGGDGDLTLGSRLPCAPRATGTDRHRYRYAEHRSDVLPRLVSGPRARNSVERPHEHHDRALITPVWERHRVLLPARTPAWATRTSRRSWVPATVEGTTERVVYQPIKVRRPVPGRFSGSGGTASSRSESTVARSGASRAVRFLTSFCSHPLT